MSEIIERWDLSHPWTRYDVEHPRLLVAEMRECAENGTDLQFR